MDKSQYTAYRFKTALDAHEARGAFGKQLHGDYFSAGGVLSL